MMIKEYKFDIMYKNELVTEVSVHGEDIFVTKHIHNVAIQPFYGGLITMERIEDFLRSRCFSSSRTDKKDLLSYLKLENYNPISIIKKTHGHMYHDCLWIRFPGEMLTWEDVKNGTC